ncbi:uncharacterized protein LKV04_019540 [Tautogolabrus adspersus]
MPCGGGSTCVPRFNETFECLCLPGNVYNKDSSTCDGAKVFPGQLTLEGDYNEKYDDSTSKEFLDLSKEIVAELQKVFGGTVGYSKSTVQKLKPSNSARVWSRETNKIFAEVENIFEPTAVIGATKITETLETAIKDSKEGLLKGAGFKAWQLAVVIVGSVLGVVVLSSGTVIGVLALRPAKKSSKKKKDEETAKPYVSNFSTKAPLVNRSTGNGQGPSVNGLANGRGPSVNGLANGRGPSVNGSANAYASAGVPRIPRATTTSGMDYRTNLEMTPSNSRQNLVPTGRNTRLYDDPDDINPYTQARPQNNPYAQNPPQNNPYAQNRPQNNPYSAKEGHTNPYYTNDNGRRLY